MGSDRNSARPLALALSLLALVACSGSAPPGAADKEASAEVGSALPAGATRTAAAPGLNTSEVPPGVTVTALPCSAPDGPLGASLLRPTGAPRRVAILEVGAQPWNRWGNTSARAYNHYRDLAFALVQGGLAVVVYDKRGTGESPGPINQIRGRVRDAEAISTCTHQALPGVGQLAVGHSMGTVVVARANTVRVGTVLLSPLLPRGETVSGPVLKLRGERDGAGEGEIIPGADHLLMREGHLAPEVAARILAWEKTVGG